MSVRTVPQVPEGTLADALTRIERLEATNAALERRMLSLFDLVAAAHEYAGLTTEAVRIRSAARPGRIGRQGLSIVRATG